MPLFGKNKTPLTGDIEMISIPSAKKLGNKTRTRSIDTRHNSIRTSRSSNLSSKNATVSSASAKRLLKLNTKHIYATRVHTSICRGRSKSSCTRKQLCKFTKGPIRFYCRKKYNKRV